MILYEIEHINRMAVASTKIYKRSTKPPFPVLRVTSVSVDLTVLP